VVALFPLLLVFCKFFVVIMVMTGFIADVPSPGVMQRPRSPRTAACSRADCSSVVSPNPAPALHHPKRALAASGGRQRLANQRELAFSAPAWAACHS